MKRKFEFQWLNNVEGYRSPCWMFPTLGVRLQPEGRFPWLALLFFAGRKSWGIRIYFCFPDEEDIQ